MSVRTTLIALAVAIATISTATRAEPLSADSIIALSRSGIGDEAIIAKVKSDGTPFDLSTDQMISLRQAGVSSAVIAAMLNNKPSEPVMSMDSPDPNVPHPSGVYLLAGRGETVRMRRIDPTVSNQAKTGGIFGYALTGGLASASIKVSIQNETATAKSGSQPTFYFFFDQANNLSASGTWASGMNTIVSSPAEFTLIRLTRKEGRREARVGSMNIAGAKTGVMDKDRIPFAHQMVRPGVYQINVGQPLPAGEYGFIFSLAGGGTGGAMTARIFDFSVDQAIESARPVARSEVRPTAAPQPASSSASTTVTRSRAKGVRCDTCR